MRLEEQPRELTTFMQKGDHLDHESELDHEFEYLESTSESDRARRLKQLLSGGWKLFAHAQSKHGIRDGLFPPSPTHSLLFGLSFALK